jgi:GntR family transcriptional repressor for pyruvate dehydrogenase complex
MNYSVLEYSVLDAISRLKTPVGASFLCSVIDSSQASIGRALQAMEARGFLEKVSNKGRTLTDKGRDYLQLLQQDIDSREYVDVLFDLFSASDRQTYLDILETRLLLEQKTVRLACEKATKNEIAELEAILIRHQRARAMGKPAENENLDFHYKIAELARNPIISQLLRLIMTQKSAYIHFSVMNYRSLTGSILFHVQIFEAIRDRDPQRASDLMSQHLTALIDILMDIEHMQSDL